MNTPTEVAAFLENLNAWRRGDEAIEMPSPDGIGFAIESAVALLRELAKEREKVRVLRAACKHVDYLPRIQSALAKTEDAK